MRKVLLFLIVTLCFLLVIPSVHADMGPKPTTTVEVIGFDVDYKFDLLAQFGDEQVYVLNDQQFVEYTEVEYYDQVYPSILNGFQDQDGFAAYSLYTNAPHVISVSSDNPNIFHCGYFSPPDVFKVVLVTENKDIIISSVVEKEMFAAFVTFDLRELSLDSHSYQAYNDYKVYQLDDSYIHEHIPVGSTIAQILVTVLSTIIIELSVLFAFKYKNKKSFTFVTSVNIGTQLLLYSAMALSYLYGNFWGYIGALFIGEILVFITEVALYAIFLKEHKKGRAIAYAIVANLASVILGLVVMSIWL